MSQKKLSKTHGPHKNWTPKKKFWWLVRTDHASLQWLFRQNADGMTIRLIQKMQEYDFRVVDRPAQKHNNADGLSRRPNGKPE